MTRIISIVGGLQPSTPTIGTATAGDTTASVAFTASTYIGKGTITYTATSSPGGITGTASSSPITVTGLTNGTAYTFTVTGTTNYGVTSIASSASNSITPAPQDAGAMIPIFATTVGPAGAASITFSNIPATYTHLQVRYTAQTNRTDYPVDVVTMQVGNGSIDTGTNYSSHTLTVSGGSTVGSGGAANQPEIYSLIATGQNITNNYGVAVIDLVDYAKTNKYKSFKAISGDDLNGTVSGAGGFLMLISGNWRNTSVITHVKLTPVVGTAFNQFSSFALYGIKGA